MAPRDRRKGAGLGLAGVSRVDACAGWQALQGADGSPSSTAPEVDVDPIAVLGPDDLRARVIWEMAGMTRETLVELVALTEALSRRAGGRPAPRRRARTPA
jgi:hypothetical protein